jgi:uncharacterized protein (TIGR03089 family)
MPDDLLPLLGSWDPAPPRLVWYGPDGERVELSGRTLRTWVVKAANLLHTEADAGPGTRVAIALPVHWRALVWHVATHAVGADPVLVTADGEDPGPFDVVVTDRPGDAPSADLVVAVPLPALAMAWPGALPAGALDGAAELMAQPDDPLFAPPPPLRGAPAGGPRVLLLAEPPVGELVDRAWRAWSAGGSVVLVTPRPDAALTAIAGQEHAAVAEPNILEVRRAQGVVDGHVDRATILEVLREGRGE